MKILINGSNLHGGGPLQVATSFIFELSYSQLPLSNIDFLVSDKLYEELKGVGANLQKLNVINFNSRGIFNPRLKKILKDYQIVFTIFGPLYLFLPRHIITITGFAQAWIFQKFSSEAYMAYKFFKRPLIYIKYKIQKYFYFRSYILVVEAKHVLDSLSQLGFDRVKIFLAPNTISKIFKDHCEKNLINQSINLHNKNIIKIGFIGKNYPHKNTQILKGLKSLLQINYSLNSEIFVTFSDDEFSKFSSFDVLNYGVVSNSDCYDFYDDMDLIVFPSLLESFSVTPLEAIASGKILLASDRIFNRDICGNHAVYFDPLDIHDLAQKIYYCISDQPYIDKALYLNHANEIGNSTTRMMQYFNIIDLCRKISDEK